jgi:hypothetical protein
MTLSDLAREIVSTYRKHGWQLRRALLRTESRAQIFRDSSEKQLWGDVRIDESTMDALWFSRPSHQQREAWELRLLAESPYALLETFEADEDEELRDEARMEMEARMRERTG